MHCWLAAIWQASAALGLEVSLSVVACNTTFSGSLFSHFEMSLGAHGHDREIYRTQHLFCHGAKEQLAYLAPAPGSEKDAVHLELSRGSENLLGGISFANHRIADDVLASSHGAPWFHGFGSEVD